MLRRDRGIWYAIAAVAVVTAVYVRAYPPGSELPRASSLIGHGLGAAGVALMLVTQVAYSVRKQLDPAARWGTLAAWLRFHVFTGIVGPYMVVLHAATAFRGFAGITMALTGVVVASGVVGRYLYTAVPRSAGGIVATGGRRALATWHAVHVPLTWVLFAFAIIHGAAALYYGALQR